MTGDPFASAVVVVGASGFVGRNLVEALAGRTGQLIGVTGSGREVPGCDLTVRGAEMAAIPPLPDDTVLVHLAAYRYDATRHDLVQSDILVHNNALNAEVFRFCVERGIREVRLASSIAVYPAGLAVMDDAVSIDLNAPPHASEAFYAWSKRFAETMAQLYAGRFGLNVQTFRLSNPYGPFDSIDPGKAHVAPAFVMKALSKEPTFVIRGDPSVERDFVYVGDVVEVFLRSLAQRGKAGTYNLATGGTTCLQALAEAVLEIAGVDKPIVAGAPGAFGPAVRCSTGARVREAFDLNFCDLRTGLQPTVDWYRNALRA